MSIASTLPSVPKRTSAVSRSSAVELRAAEAVGAAEADGRGDRALERADVGEVRHRVTDVESLGVRGGLVDGDLVRPDRRAAFLDRHPLEPVVALPRHSERRATGRSDRLAVGIEQLREPLEDRFDDLDAVDLADRVGDGDIDRIAGVVGGELLRGPNLEVDVVVEFLEQAVERRPQAVGEHERSDDERHAGGDGERDRQCPAPSGADASSSDQ